MDHEQLADVIDRLLAADGHAWPDCSAGDAQLLLVGPVPRRIALEHESAIARAEPATHDDAGGVDVDVRDIEVGAAVDDDVDALRFVELDGLGEGGGRPEKRDSSQHTGA